MTWSLLYGALGLFWALGGAGYPFGENDAGGAEWMSVLGGLRVETGAPIIAVLGLAGAVVALAMSRAWGHGVSRGVLLGFGWTMSAILLLVVPDARILALLAYLPALVFALGFDAVEWPIVNQAVCLAGGFIWVAATLQYQRRTRSVPERGAQTEENADWTAPAAAARWGRWATLLAFVAPLPYAAIRLAWALGFPFGLDGELMAGFDVAGGGIAALTLGAMAFGGALLTLGLIQRWGEVFPGWVPLLGGSRVPPALAIVPATVMSVVLTVGGLTMLRLQIAGHFDSVGWGAGVPSLFFLPWGVALGLAVLAYYLRRRGERPCRGDYLLETRATL